MPKSKKPKVVTLPVPILQNMRPGGLTDCLIKTISYRMFNWDLSGRPPRNATGKRARRYWDRLVDADEYLALRVGRVNFELPGTSAPLPRS